MGKLNPGFDFTGSIGNVTAYKMKGVDGIVVRSKGGASKEKIKNSPRFEGTRRQNDEFGGRATASGWIMRTLQQQKRVADHNIAGPLNALFKIIQDMDKTSVLGQRSIQFSKAPELLEGFSMNRIYSFDSTVRQAIKYDLDKDARTASLSFPSLVPGINFFPNTQEPMFKIQATLGLIPDLFHAKPTYNPSDKAYMHNELTVETEWYPVQTGTSGNTLELELKSVPPNDQFILVLSVGICFGTLTAINKVKQKKYAGAAKIIAVK